MNRLSDADITIGYNGVKVESQQMNKRSVVQIANALLKILVAAVAVLVILPIIVMVIVSIAEPLFVRYAHQSHEFNNDDRAAVEAVKKSSSGSIQAMHLSLETYVDAPAVGECKYSVYRYKHPDSFRVYCYTRIDHCVTQSSMLRPIGSDAPVCYVQFAWEYATSAGVRNAEWRDHSTSD